MDQISPLSTDPIAEAHHRIANSLSLLGGLVRMQARAVGLASKPFAKAEVRLLLDGIAARISSVGHLHRLLAHMHGEGAIDLNSHLREVAGNLVAAFSSEQQPVRIEHGGSDCLILTRCVQPLTLMLCEILANAMKHAHPAGMPVKIVLSCEALCDGALQMTVSDDGVGLPEGFDTARDGGLGFQIIRALATELGGRLDIFSDNLGVTFRLRVPQALVANARTA